MGDIDEYVTGLIVSNQFSLKKGLKLFGDKVEAATGEELQQIIDILLLIHVYVCM